MQKEASVTVKGPAEVERIFLVLQQVDEHIIDFLPPLLFRLFGFINLLRAVNRWQQLFGLIFIFLVVLVVVRVLLHVVEHVIDDVEVRLELHVGLR